MSRILFITERFPPDIGGVAASAFRVCQSLVALGHHVDVVSWSRFVQAGKMQKFEVSPGLRLFVVGQFRQWDMTMPATLNILEWLHETEAYEFVWGHYLFPAGFLAVWFSRQHEITSTVSARGNDLDREIFPPGDFSRLLWTLQNVQTITAVSRDMANKIEALCGRTDIRVMHNVVDTNIFQADALVPPLQKNEFGILEGEVVLGFSGELRDKKGLQFLLESLTAVRKECPACLLVIGDVRQAQRPTLQLFEAEYPEDYARLIITGHTPDPAVVASRLALCDIYLQPSLFEGMPNALLEAMACERLCIGSDAGGIPEIIEHGINGFMLKRALLNHLSTAILEALDLEPSRKFEICKNARRTVVERFSPEQERARLRDFTLPVGDIV